MKALMSLQEAAAETPFSVDTLKRAINSTDPNGPWPPLRAKKQQGGKGRYLIRAADLEAWIESLPDA